MDSRITPQPVTLTYPQVEHALAGLFGVTQRRNIEGWFRGRIIHLRRRGLAPPSGRGRPFAYTTSWVERWFLGLALSIEHGHEPEQVAGFIQKEWRRQTGPNAVDRGEGSLRDLCAHARTSETDTDHTYLTVAPPRKGEPPNIRYTTGIKAFESIAYDSLAKRVWPQIIDLTVAMHDVDAAIAKAANPETEPREPPKKTPREILRDHQRRQGEE